MPTQLTLDFTTRPQPQGQPIIRNNAWFDVSDIARGVAFTESAQVSIALNDVLEHHNEMYSDYDQRLYDALWLAHFRLSLDQSQSATFNFIFQRKDWKTEKITEVSLRLRVEAQNHIVLLGLLEDF